jgi:hypothetical protein
VAAPERASNRQRGDSEAGDRVKIDRIKWNMAGFKELRNSAEVQADLLARAKRIQAPLGDGYSANVSSGKNRARASVTAYHPKAINENAKRNTILNNLDRGRNG